jgi:hypothetical protein
VEVAEENAVVVAEARIELPVALVVLVAVADVVVVSSCVWLVAVCVAVEVENPVVVAA